MANASREAIGFFILIPRFFWLLFSDRQQHVRFQAVFHADFERIAVFPTTSEGGTVPII
jgi:hypothetical protein